MHQIIAETDPLSDVPETNSGCIKIVFASLKEFAFNPAEEAKHSNCSPMAVFALTDYHMLSNESLMHACACYHKSKCNEHS